MIAVSVIKTPLFHLASLLGLLITVCNYFLVNSSFLYDYNVVFLAYFCH